MTTLGNICHFVRGPFGGALKKDFFVDDGYAVYEQQHAIYNQFEDIRYFVGSKKFEEMKRFELNSGDLIMSCSGTMGRIAIVPEGIKRGIINQALLKLTPKPEVDARYLKYWIESESFQSRLNDHTHGAAIKNVASVAVLRDLPIPVPPLPEQRRIAAILDQADALRAKRREALAQLDSLTQSIFVEMFGDPVTNPKGWPIRKLGNVGSLDRGVSKHRPRNAPELLGGKYPLVQTGEIANCDGYIRNHNSTYSELGLKQSKIWPAGTLCITIAANIAKTGILTFDACFPDSVVGFTAKNWETVEYVRVWLSFLQKALESAAPESAQKNINLAILRALDIPFPPMLLQLKFAEALGNAQKLATTHRTSLAETEALFASLQHRAFRGEL